MFEEEAYLKMIEQLGDMVDKAIKKAKIHKKWLTKEETKSLLGYISASKLQKLRDKGEIDFTHHGKVILYCRKV